VDSDVKREQFKTLYKVGKSPTGPNDHYNWDHKEDYKPWDKACIRVNQWRLPTFGEINKNRYDVIS